MEVVLSNLRYYPSTCLIKPVWYGTYPSQANIQKKRGKWVTAGASFVQYQIGTALNHQLFCAQVMKNSLSQVISSPISHSPIYVR
jgi:hypothetical protein